MITITCVKWGTKYGPNYVNNLYNSVKRNLTIPFTFVCFTEDSTNLNKNIKIIPFEKKLPIKHVGFQGWWYKLEMFRPNNGLTGRVFYLDLDTVIVDNIDKIASYTNGFVILRDFYRGFRGNKHNLTLTNEVGSGLMQWTAENHTHLWNNFIDNAEKIINSYGGGDQIWIQEQQSERIYFQDLFPNQIISFKVHCIPNKNEWKINSALPINTCIVCFHGTPRPHEVAHHDWMKSHWR